MEKTGSKNKYSGILSNIGILDEKIKDTNLSKESENEFKRLSVEIVRIGKSKSIQEILNLERTLIRDELEKCSNDISASSTKTSLTTAMNELDLAYDAFVMLSTNKNEYKKMTDTLISRRNIDRTKDGIPRDSFHRFIDSHKTRLGNRIISADPTPNKRICLTCSRNNMEICKQEYKKLQTVVLDIKLPDKSKERER